MTDAEIKNNLMFIAHYCHDEYNEIRVDVLLLEALDLINRQQAEIADERAKGNICAEVIARQDKEIAKYKAEIKNYSRNNRSLTGTVTEMQKALKKQSAEIERLQNECFCIANEREAIGECLNTAVDEAKAEAIKEFAERLKEEANPHYFDNYAFAVPVAFIDNLVKEMVGDAE